ncbi:MAG TPA: hypothetical protein VF458_09465 [Ktedonobacteraceae bacterium]
MRIQQRMMLYYYMVANEREVPATSSSIIEAIRRESEKAAVSETGSSETQARSARAPLPAVAYGTVPIPLHSRSPHRRRIFQNMLTLATVVAVILAAVGLLNRFMAHPANTASTNQSSHPGQTSNPAAPLNNDDWNSALIGLTVLSAGVVSSLNFYGYDTGSGRMTTLVSSTQTYLTVTMEGVSQDGQHLLFDETTPDQQKTYNVYSRAHNVLKVYQVVAHQGGNAIWMDTTHFLVQTIGGGVQELNAQTGLIQQKWALQAGSLTFYRQPFLYFTGAKNLESGALYRANLAQANPIPQRITNSLPDTHYWLSIDGTTIFYANRGSSSERGIYAVGSDGSHLRMLRKGSGIPIGYADDNSLMVMDQVENKFRVVKLGTTPGAPEKVVLADAAPGAVSLCGLPVQAAMTKVCDQNIELAPYGHGLLLNAYYPNGANALLYDNLHTGASHIIRSLPTGTGVQLPGWSKMSLSPAA